MTRSKVKVTIPLKLEILQFSKSISSGIFNVSWQMTTDFDYELGTKFRLIVVYLLRKNMEIKVSAFGNFSTDTGSTDCNHVNINVFRFRRSRPSVPHGANFSYFKMNFQKRFVILCTNSTLCVCGVCMLAMSKRSAEWCKFRGNQWCLGDSGGPEMKCVTVTGCL